jgi:hypothetical protein
LSISDLSPYLSSGGEPATRLSVVAYFDVLGFVDETRQAYQNGGSPELLVRLRNALTAGYESLRDNFSQEKGKVPAWDVKTFTDNVVIGYPIHGDGEVELGSVLESLGLFQLSLVLEGFFIRGGISVGHLYMDRDIVFGGGLLEAYDAESKLARDPRIVLADSARRYLLEHLRYYASPDVAPQGLAVLKDEDDQLFLNYLASVFVSVPPSTEWLEQHKAAVESRLQAFRGRPPLWSKYAWAARYHNHFCSSYSDFVKFLIDSDLYMQRIRWLHEK